MSMQQVTTTRARTTPDMAGNHFDVIVVGAGPGGAICAHHLGALGHSVLLVDREDRGRFHVGESLIPYLVEVWANEGIADAVAAGPFVYKPGIQIEDRQTDRIINVEFSWTPPNRRDHAYNVERAELDGLLTDLAVGAGVHVVQNADVTDFHSNEDRIVGVCYHWSGRSYDATARWVVDASGRAGLLARRFGLRKHNPRLKNIAVFQHFDNVTEGINRADEGCQVVSIHDDGWVWCIPIGPRTFSVGTVTNASKVKSGASRRTFEEHLQRAPLIAGALHDATTRYGDVKVQSDFCYHAEHLAGPGWFMVGDAGCFVDPLFSGGVFLASIGGIKAAEAIDRLLSDADEAREISAYEQVVKTGYDTYFRLMYSFYERSQFSVARLFDSLPASPAHFGQMLSGDFWSNPNAAWLRTQSDLDTFERPFDFVATDPVYTDGLVNLAAVHGRWA